MALWLTCACEQSLLSKRATITLIAVKINHNRSYKKDKSERGQISGLLKREETVTKILAFRRP